LRSFSDWVEIAISLIEDSTIPFLPASLDVLRASGEPPETMMTTVVVGIVGDLEG